MVDPLQKWIFFKPIVNVNKSPNMNEERKPIRRAFLAMRDV
jgi:hypothetical protein